MKGQNTNNVVMIADDDMFTRKVIASAVRDFADVVEILDGAQVEEAYRQHWPDMVFLDIHLPNMMGPDLLKKLFKIDVGAYVVMISADSSSDNVMLSKRRGAKGFMTKPFDKNRVMHYFNICPTIKFMDYEPAKKG